MCKIKFVLDGIVGHPYGSSFAIHDGQLVKASSGDMAGCSADEGFSHSVFTINVSVKLTMIYRFGN